MNILQRLLKRLSPETAERNKKILTSLYSYSTFGAFVQPYQNLKQLIDEGFKRNVDVYSVVNWTAENAANIPICVEIERGGEWIKAENHPLQKLIDKPNPYQSGLEFAHQVYGFYQTTGNTFIYGNRQEAGVNQGQPQELFIMPSQHTEIKTGGWMNPIKGYSLNLVGGECHELPYEDVLHMKALTLEFGNGQEFWGMSPLRAGLLSLERSNANYQAASTAYKTMGMAGILSVEDDEFTPVLSEEQQQQAERRLDEDYMGVFNQGKTMVTNRNVEYTKLGLSPVDLNLLQDKQATLRDICNIYKVSSIIFNDNENSTYNNAEQAIKRAYSDAIKPLVDRYVQELNEWLAPSYGDNVRIVADYSRVTALQKDYKELSEWITRLTDGKIITPNEGREFLGKEPIEDEFMDKVYTNAGTIALEDTSFDPFIETPEAAKAAGEHYLKK